MAINGPVVLVDDDPNDLEVIESALKELGVPYAVRGFTRAEGALEYLLTTDEQPFIILADIRMSGVNGLTFRKSIMDDEYLRRKCIPFVFLTDAVSVDIVNEAYDMMVQGFYRKASSYAALKEQLSAIVIYWSHCLHPNREL